jgi:hypothetical protein
MITLHYSSSLPLQLFEKERRWDGRALTERQVWAIVFLKLDPGNTLPGV